MKFFVLSKNNFLLPPIPDKLPDIDMLRVIFINYNSTLKDILNSLVYAGELSTSSLTVNLTVSEYVDNAAAVAAGLSVGDVYRTGDDLKIVH
jgi:hypothetical protein